MALIGQYQQTTFSNPQNGQAPDADVVRNNDNAVTAKHNSHDADATIHIQTGTLASRPAAGTAYAVYIDENKRIYVDNGSTWAEVPYARLDAAGTNAFDNNVSIGGTLTVTTGLTDVMDVDAADIVADTVTAATLTGAHSGSGAGLTSLPAAQLTGTIDSARLPTSATFSGGVTSGGGFIQTGGASRGHRTTSSGSGTVTINGANGNDFRHTTTGTTTLAITGLSNGQFVYLEVVNGGGHTVTFSGVTSWGGGNTAPTVTTTAGRKDCFVFKQSGSDTLGFVVDQNFVSSS